MKNHLKARRIISFITSASLLISCFSAPYAFAQSMATTGQFAVTESGAAAYSVPIQVPSGIAGIEPRLSINYSSQGGNGLLGMGWSLGGLSSIGRCSQTQGQDNNRNGVNLNIDDKFCMDGQRLILFSGSYGSTGSEYRTERESFSKITHNSNDTFTVKTKAGLTIEYGNNATNAFIEAQGKSVPRLWAVNKMTDAVGNYLTVTYAKDDANGDFTPVQIDYTGNVSTGQAATAVVKFDYFEAQPRLDIPAVYLGGSVVKTMKRLNKIQTYSSGAALTQVKEYRLTYAAQANAADRSKLTSITECDGASSGAACLPSINVTWPAVTAEMSLPSFASPVLPDAVSGIASCMFDASTGSIASVSGGLATYNAAAHLMRLGDFNGDGVTDYMWVPNGSDGRWLVAYGTSKGFSCPVVAIPASIDGYMSYSSSAHNTQFADFNGDGRTDYMWIPQDSDGRWLIAYATATGFTLPTYANPALPAIIDGYGNRHSDANYMKFFDFNGDGKTDFMWIPYNSDGRWVISYATGTGTGFTAPNMLNPVLPNIVNGFYNRHSSPIYNQFADFNGDGKMDYMWMPHQGDGRWVIAYGTATGFTSPSYDSPALPASTNSYYNYHAQVQYMRFADFNGDGKTDYMWLPNNGDGRWVIAYSNGNGTFTPPNYANPALPTSLSSGHLTRHGSAQYEFFADFNGDGKTDYMWMPSGQTRWLIAYSKGDGTFTLPAFANPVIPELIDGYASYNAAAQYMRLGDFNGDGLTDYMWMPNGQTRWLIAYSTGNGFTTPVYATPAIPSSIDGKAAYNGTAQYMMFADFNGDGKTDYMWMPNGQTRWLISYAQKPPELVSSITSAGRTIAAISYKALTDATPTDMTGKFTGTMATYTKDAGVNASVFPILDLQMPMQVVSSVNSPNGNGGTNTIYYAYGGLKAEVGSGRGMLGFRWMASKEAATGIESYTEYRQNWPYTGMASKSETRIKTGAGNNGLLKQTTAEPACLSPNTNLACSIAPGTRYFTYTATTTESSWDLSGAVFPSTTTTFAYVKNGSDSELYGDPTTITVTNSGGGTKTTVNEYEPANTSAWILGRLKKAVVTSVAPDTAVGTVASLMNASASNTATTSSTTTVADPTIINLIVSMLLEDDD